MARIRDFYGVLLSPDKVSDISYSIYLLETDQPEKRTAVRGHQAVSLNPSEVLYAQMQQNPNRTADDIGFNFLWTLNVKNSNAFQLAGRHYLVEFKLTVNQNVFFIRYRLFVL